MEEAGRCAGCELGATGLGLLKSALVVDDPLVPQLLEKLADIRANLPGIGVAELGLQFCDDLGEGALSVAALEDLPPGALQLDRAFGEQNSTIFFRTAPAATGGQARLAGVFRRRHLSCPRSETLQATAIPVPRTRSRARRAAPTGCRICRAGLGSPTPARLASSRCRRHSS